MAPLIARQHPPPSPPPWEPSSHWDSGSDSDLPDDSDPEDSFFSARSAAAEDDDKDCSSCEGRTKKLRDEDTRMLKILSKRRSQRNWDKVRKFVMYTWGPSNLDPTDRSGKWPEGSMMDSLHGSFHKKRKPIRRATSSVNRTTRVPADMGAIDIERVGEVQQSSSSRQP